MRKHPCIAFALAAFIVAPAFAGGPSLKTEDEKTIYALGLLIAKSLQPYRLSKAELAVLEAGINDGVLKHKPKVDMEHYHMQIQKLRDARNAAAAAEEKKAAQAFLDKAAAAPGAKRTKSGLIISEIKPGSGESPKATDKVKVHYHGTLRDGTVFDSSVERGEPATFPLNRVIPCWTEGLQLMKVGGKSRLVCPSDIAYGDRGAPPKIKPGAALMFDVELLEIVK